jgi:hypothetical protein
MGPDHVQKPLIVPVRRPVGNVTQTCALLAMLGLLSDLRSIASVYHMHRHCKGKCYPVGEMYFFFE